jgi:hypothetical protein
LPQWSNLSTFGPSVDVAVSCRFDACREKLVCDDRQAPLRPGKAPPPFTGFGDFAALFGGIGVEWPTTAGMSDKDAKLHCVRGFPTYRQGV